MGAIVAEKRAGVDSDTPSLRRYCRRSDCTISEDDRCHLDSLKQSETLQQIIELRYT